MREYHYQPRLTGEALQAAKDNGTPYYPSAKWGTGRVETRESVTRNAIRNGAIAVALENARVKAAHVSEPWHRDSNPFA